MTNASSDARVALDVAASDAATEIFLIDAHLDRREKAVGMMTAHVAPGLYKLRLRAGRAQVDRLIEVPPEGLSLDAPPVLFPSAMPLDDTVSANAAHAQLVHDATRTRRRRGSRLCIVARDPVDAQQDAAWGGLTVHALDGTRIADIGDASHAPGITTLTLDLDPGFARLRFRSHVAPEHEIFVPLPEGFQTQVFMFCDVQDDVRIPRLRDASIRIAPIGATFDPDDAVLRLGELLRHSLEDGRDILTDSVLAQLCKMQTTHTMPGLLAAHLLARSSSADDGRIAQILRNIDPVIAALPDARALVLAGRDTPPKALVFDVPPMLRSSWTLIAKASRRRMGLVPYGSLTARVGEGLVGHPLWLINGRVDTAPGDGGDTMSFAAAQRFLEDLAALDPATLNAQVEGSMADASPLERSLFNATLGSHAASRGRPEKRAAKGVVASALRETDVPRYSIARSAQRLKKQLDL